jgi:flagella basal body P-ring formation protein FlgA
MMQLVCAAVWQLYPLLAAAYGELRAAVGKALARATAVSPSCPMHSLQQPVLVNEGNFVHAVATQAAMSVAARACRCTS